MFENKKSVKIDFYLILLDFFMINKTFFSFFTCFILPFVLFAAPVETSKTKMLQDIDLIKSIFDVKYAPAQWKKEYSGWDLDAEVQTVKNTILQQNPLSTRDYQKILLNFFHSMQDYHVKVNFYATEISVLPFRIQGANGRYFVAWLDGNPALYAEFDPGLAEMLTNTKIGDEVISMGGKPAEEYMKAFRARAFGREANGTNQMLAEQYLTLRMANQGVDVEQGPMQVVIKHQATGQTQAYTPHWIHIPEQIKHHYPSAALQQFHVIPQKKEKVKLFDKMMLTPFYADLEKSRNELKKLGLDINKTASDFMVLAQHKSFVPELGKVLWSNANSHYHAYIFATPKGKKVGYIRIPTFAVYDEEYLDFEQLIQRFEKETDALVIDQLNNPGGLVLYLFSLLSRLTDRPLELPQERMTITQQDVSEALMVLDDPTEALEDLMRGIMGFSISPDDIPDVTAYFQMIIEEWNAGRSFTNPLYFYGIPAIKPNPVHYSKPILILVNYLDFSCADFFPAIMQDNKRAKIFGSKTAGAGGFVLRHEYPNLFGIQSFSYTGSIAYRTNNNPIENLGVTPDFPYEITVDDLTNGYKSYAQAVNKALESMM